MYFIYRYAHLYFLKMAPERGDFLQAVPSIPSNSIFCSRSMLLKLHSNSLKLSNNAVHYILHSLISFSMYGMLCLYRVQETILFTVY